MVRQIILFKSNYQKLFRTKKHRIREGGGGIIAQSLLPVLAALSALGSIPSIPEILYEEKNVAGNFLKGC